MSTVSDRLHEGQANRDQEDDVFGGCCSPGIATRLLRPTAASATRSPTRTVSAKKRWLRQAIGEDRSEGVANSNDNNGNCNAGAGCHEDHSAEVTSNNNNNNTGTESHEDRSAERVNNINSGGAGCHEDRSAQKSNNNDGTGGIVALSGEVLPVNTGVETCSDHVTPLKVRRLAQFKEEQGLGEVNVVEAGASSSSRSSPPMVAVVPKAVEAAESAREPIEPSWAAKTPEPSPMFSAYFKSDVSLEQLEAQLEMVKRQRNLAVGWDRTVVNADKHVEATSSSKVVAVATEQCSAGATIKTEPSELSVGEEFEGARMAPSPQKRRLSLADYRQRRRDSENSEYTSGTPTLDERGTPTLDERATPTLDEHPVGLPLPMPTLDALPLFAHLERAQKEKNLREGKQTTLLHDNKVKRD